MTEKPSVKEYVEEAAETDFDAFETVVRSRRSVRRYLDEPIPDEVVERCLDLALLAPTSSNLQCWEFYRIVSPEKKAKLVDACLSQSAARTAPELFVAVARLDTWKANARDILHTYEASEYDWPATVRLYYQVIARVAYAQGFVGGFGAMKRALGFATGFFRAIPRGPASRAELITWSVKTTALACENLMLAFRAAGYDTCPMEGMDEVRVKRLLGLGRESVVVMVISAGRRAPDGVYGPQLRLPRERFLKTV